jgi:hypothetical protein
MVVLAVLVIRSPDNQGLGNNNSIVLCNYQEIYKYVPTTSSLASVNDKSSFGVFFKTSSPHIESGQASGISQQP